MSRFRTPPNGALGTTRDRTKNRDSANDDDVDDVDDDDDDDDDNDDDDDHNHEDDDDEDDDDDDDDDDDHDDYDEQHKDEKYASHRSRSENDKSSNSEITLRCSTPDSRDPTATQSSKKIIQPPDPTNQYKTTRKNKQNSTSGTLQVNRKENNIIKIQVIENVEIHERYAR